VATERQVETKLRALIKRLEAADQGVQALSQALPEPRIIAVLVTDLGRTYWSELSGGKMGVLHRGEPDRADIRIQARGDDLIEMIDGERSMFSAYLSGRIKLEASFSDILRLRSLA